MPELIRLKSKLEKKDYKIREDLKRIRKYMKIEIQREYIRHKDTTRHDGVLPSMSITAKCHDLSCHVNGIQELLVLTKKNHEAQNAAV